MTKLLFLLLGLLLVSCAHMDNSLPESNFNFPDPELSAEEMATGGIIFYVNGSTHKAMKEPKSFGNANNLSTENTTILAQTWTGRVVDPTTLVISHASHRMVNNGNATTEVYLNQ